MNISGDSTPFRKVLGWIAVAVLGTHLAICLALVVSPKHGLVHTSVGKMYNFFALLGPFFKDDRIQSSSHFYVRYYTDDEWMDYTDLTDSFFKGYLQQPWKFHKLVLRDYTGSVSSNFASSSRNKDIKILKGSYSFKRLHQFVEIAMPDSQGSDSVQCISIVKQYNASDNSMKLDTIFDVKYYPGDLR